MGTMASSGKISLGRPSEFTAAEHDTRSIAHVHGSHYTDSDDDGNDDNSNVRLGAFRRNHPVYPDHVHSTNTGVPTLSDGEVRFSDFYSTTSGTNTRWSSSDVSITGSGGGFVSISTDYNYGNARLASTQLKCTWQTSSNRLRVQIYDHTLEGSVNDYDLRNTYYLYITGGLDAGTTQRFSSIDRLDCNFVFSNCYLYCYSQIDASGTAVFSCKYRQSSSNMETGTTSFYAVDSNSLSDPFNKTTDYWQASSGNPSNNSTFGWGIFASANAGSPQSIDNIKSVTFQTKTGGYIDCNFRLYSERRFTTVKIRKNRYSNGNPYLLAHSTDKGYSGGKG